MLIKKILGFSMASTALAITGPAIAYLTKSEAPLNTVQEEGAQVAGAGEATSSNVQYSYDSWGWDF